MNYKSQFLSSPDCSFGGICIFKELNGVSNDYECICTNYKPNLGLSRNIYSSGSSASLILYWYKEYNEIEVALNISKSTCRVVIIDPCAAEYFCYPCTTTHSKEFNCKLDIDCYLACNGGNPNISCQNYLNEITKFTNVKLQTNKNKLVHTVVTYFFSMPFETCFVLQLRKQFLSDSLSSQVNDIFICSMSLEPSPVPYGQTGFEFMITGQLDSETSSLGHISFRNENYNRTYCVYELIDNTTKCSYHTDSRHIIQSSKLEETRFLMFSEAKSYLSKSITMAYKTIPSSQHWVDFMVWKRKLQDKQYISESVPLSVDQYYFVLKKVSDKLEDVLYLKALEVSANKALLHNKYNIRIHSNYFDYIDYYFDWASKMTLFDLQRGYVISLPEIMYHISFIKLYDLSSVSHPDISLDVVWISDNYKRYSKQSHICKFTSKLSITKAMLCFNLSLGGIETIYI